MAEKKTTKAKKPEPAEESVEAVGEAGVRGDVTDPTPNDHYTVAGVTAGKPTPETDPEAYAAAGHRVRTQGGPGNGPGQE